MLVTVSFSFSTTDLVFVINRSNHTTLTLTSLECTQYNQYIT